jgi:quercetin dioxygenase-like cupin family protein
LVSPPPRCQQAHGTHSQEYQTRRFRHCGGRPTKGRAIRRQHAKAGYVVSGQIRLTLGTETQNLGPSDSYYAPPNVPHGATILQTAVVIDTFSPPREDYLTP